MSRFLTPRESIDLPAVELFASMGRPVASRVKVSVENALLDPQPQSALFAVTPLVIFGETDGPADGRIELDWEQDGESRSLQLPVAIQSGALNETLRLIHGAGLIANFEARNCSTAVYGKGRSESGSAERPRSKN